ncbi:hypothetical protein CBL_14047 [Carabus blaptoides fortunei]
MFTLWYSVLSWKEYRDSISSKACPRNCDAPSKPISAVTPQSKTNDYVPPTLSTSPVTKLENITRDVPAPAPAQQKTSSPLPVSSTNAPRLPVTPPPQKPVVKESPPVSPMSFGKMEQMQENKSRSGLTASPTVPRTPVSNNLSENTRPPPPRSPVSVSSKVENVPRTNLNFVKRENSYSSEEEEEEEDENDEEEEDDSEIERIDLHSK